MIDGKIGGSDRHRIRNNQIFVNFFFVAAIFAVSNGYHNMVQRFNHCCMKFRPRPSSFPSWWPLSCLGGFWASWKKNEIQINVKSSSGFRIQNIRLTREIKVLTVKSLNSRNHNFFCWQLQIHKKNCGFLSSIKFVKTPYLLLHEKNW